MSKQVIGALAVAFAAASVSEAVAAAGLTRGRCPGALAFVGDDLPGVWGCMPAPTSRSGRTLPAMARGIRGATAAVGPEIGARGGTAPCAQLDHRVLASAIITRTPRPIRGRTVLPRPCPPGATVLAGALRRLSAAFRRMPTVHRKMSPRHSDLRKSRRRNVRCRLYSRCSS